MVFQGFKKVQKRRSKLDPEPTDTTREQNNLCLFVFRIPKNRFFQSTSRQQPLTTPCLSPAKSNYFLNNEQTERISQSGLECEHGRKRRFAQ